MNIQRKDALTDVVQALLELETKPLAERPSGTVMRDDGEVITLAQSDVQLK